MIGRPDNSGAPDIKVEMALIVVTPAKADKPVPVMIMFRGGQLPGPAGLAGARLLRPAGAASGAG